MAVFSASLSERKEFMYNPEIPNGIVLVGGGGHALSLIEATGSQHFAGYTAMQPADKIDIDWLGDDAAAASLAAKGHLFHMAFVYAGLPVMRKRRALIEMYEQAGAQFATIIAPTAIVTPHCRIAEGSAVLHGAIITRATIGRNVIINTGAIVEHDCVIGDNSFIGPGVVMGGGVEIGDDCFIGLGAKLKNNIKIASGVSVAMGAVVTRDLLQPGIYHGTPLRCTQLRHQ